MGGETLGRAMCSHGAMMAPGTDDQERNGRTPNVEGTDLISKPPVCRSDAHPREPVRVRAVLHSGDAPALRPPRDSHSDMIC